MLLSMDHLNNTLAKREKRRHNLDPQENVPSPGFDRPPLSPVVTSIVCTPAIEAILMTLDGFAAVAPFFNRS
jgi:hypothetical protein